MLTASSLLLGCALAAQASSSASGWVDGPEAPASTAPIPPAVAPRDGEGGHAPPTETLVVPPVPPEDRRVLADDGLPGPLPDLRLTSTIDRRTMSQSPMLDLDSFLSAHPMPGLVWLSSSSGAARPVARGHVPGHVAIVIDDVPLVDGFGTAVAPTEVLSLVGASSFTFQHGPRAFSPSSSSLGGVLQIDTGGALAGLGETMRTDGMVAAGVGGADVESGATGLVRSGWRTLRVQAHGTVLHREDQRPGRLELGVPPQASSTNLIPGSGGAGGTVGARVDVQPFSDARLFVSWLAGRAVDVPDPTGGAAVDELGRAVDCVRATERGADVAIVGLDVARVADGLTVVPRLRVHMQRALSFDERSGRAIASIDTARDEVLRGGVSVGATLRTTTTLAWDLTPSLDVAVDGIADRATSFFASRSIRLRDAAPPGDGVPDDSRARAVDGAVARQGIVRARARLTGDLVSAELGSRLHLLQVQAPAVAVDPGRAIAVDVVGFSPSVDATLRVRLTGAVAMFVAAGSVEAGDDVAALVAGRGHGAAVVVAAPAGTTRGSERFAEVGLSTRSAGVDVDVVVFGALRPGDVALVPVEGAVAVTPRAGTDEGAAGLEGRLVLHPSLDGLSVQATLAGVVVDSDVFTADEDARAGVIQPQGSLQVGYAPTSWPVGVYGRVWGAFPQSRLSAAELEDPVLCPERPTDALVPQDSPCGGAPGFAMADVGAFVRLGQIRADVSGENAFDMQGTWRGAALGTGGAAVRLRLALLF